MESLGNNIPSLVQVSDLNQKFLCVENGKEINGSSQRLEPTERV